MPMQNLGGQTKSIMVFSEVAYWTNKAGNVVLSLTWSMSMFLKQKQKRHLHEIRFQVPED